MKLISLPLLYKYVISNATNSSFNDIEKAINSKCAIVVKRIVKYKDLSREEIEETLRHQLSLPHAKYEAQRILNDLAQYNTTYLMGGEEELKKQIRQDVIDIENKKKVKTVQLDFKETLQKAPGHLYSILSFLQKDELISLLFSAKPSKLYSFENFPENEKIVSLFELNEEIFQLLKSEEPSKYGIYKCQFVDIFKLIILNSPEVSVEKVARDTYALLVLFGDTANIYNTLGNAENFLKSNSKTSLLVLHQYLPIAPITLSLWQKIIKEKPALSTLKIVKQAQEIEESIKLSCKYKKGNYSYFFKKNKFFFEEIKDTYLELLYGSAYTQDRALAALCDSLDISGARFKKTLLVLKCYQDQIHKGDGLPDISIDGKSLGYPGYFFLKLPKKDLRNLYIGEITNNCQSIGKLGEAYLIDALVFENRANYVLIKTKKSNISLSDFYSPTDQNINYNLCDIVGYGYAFITRRGNLCFDSWENLRNQTQYELRDDAIIVSFLEKFAEEAVKNFSFQRVTIGIGGGNRTPKYYKRMQPVPFPELTAGGYHPYDSQFTQVLIAENIAKKKELAANLNIPLADLSNIISHFQMKMLEGLAKYHLEFFKTLLEKNKLIALTGPEVFNDLFLKIYPSKQDVSSEESIQVAKENLNILIDVAEKQSVIKEFLTSGSEILRRFSDGDISQGEQEILTLASRYHCIKELFRNNDMTAVLSNRGDKSEQREKNVSLYLQYECWEEILYSAKNFRFHGKLLFLFLDKIKSGSSKTIQVLLLNDVISYFLKIGQGEESIKKLLVMAEQNNMLTEVLLNISYFSSEFWERDEFISRKNDILLILEKAENANLLYKLLSEGKTAYTIIHFVSSVDSNIKSLIDKKMPELLKNAIEDKNYNFVIQWGLFSECSLELFCKFSRDNPRFLIETLPKVQFANALNKIETLVSKLLSTESIEFSHLEYCLRLIDDKEVHKFINKVFFTPKLTIGTTTTG